MTIDEVSAVNKRVWQSALRIPFAKSFLLIVNSYVWMGDSKALFGFAPFNLYFKRIGAKFLFCFAVSFLFFAFGKKYGFVKEEPSNYLDTAIQIFPNVLGFGIGAYALLFTFPERFFANLEKNRQDKKLRIGAQGLNAIMAFPLLTIAVIILAASILKVLRLHQFLVDSIGLFLILYGMLLTMELIGVLFVSARKVIRNASLQTKNESV